MLNRMLVMFSITLMLAGTALANEGEATNGDVAQAARQNEEGGDQQVPDQVTINHWSCREIADLGKKYEAEKKLPEAVVVGGKPCPKNQLAQCLLSVLEKVVKKCDTEGAEAVPREDLDRIAVLHDALKQELAKYEGYQITR
jgi:hypothetical protein